MGCIQGSGSAAAARVGEVKWGVTEERRKGKGKEKGDVGSWLEIDG